MAITVPTNAELVGPDRKGTRALLDLIRALIDQTNALTTAQVEQIQTIVQSDSSSGADLLAVMYGTNGVQVLGSVETGVEIRGSGSGISMGQALQLPNLVNFY